MTESVKALITGVTIPVALFNDALMQAEAFVLTAVVFALRLSKIVLRLLVIPDKVLEIAMMAAFAKGSAICGA